MLFIESELTMTQGIIKNQVHVLSPNDGNKLLMQRKGQYRVTERVGRCRYILHIESEVNPRHSYLLKKYIRPEKVLIWRP